jgi:predicted phage terminase large subunit-like protein
MTEHDFNAQLLQAPTSLEGGLAKRSWFKFYKDGDQPARFDQVVQSWDTANKPSQLSDFSVCTTWGVSKKLIYLLGLYRRRVAYPDLKRAVFDQAEKHSATIVLIEDKASGTQLIQELERDGLRIVKPVVPVGEKVMRFNAQTATIYNGFVYLPEQAPWLEEYLHEVTAFPGSKYDDQADSTAQALAWINTLPAEPGWVMWARQEAALGMYRTGKGIAEIAAEKDVTAEEVERWIAEYEAEEAERRRRSALEFAATCRKCGRGIPFGLTYTEVGGGDAYHTECWAKLTNGG